MLEKLSDKELIMLYAFVLDSLYLASKPEKEVVKRCVIDHRGISLLNIQEKPEDGKKIPSRRIVLTLGETKKTLSLADLHFLKWDIERQLFSAVKIEKLEWHGGDHVITVEEKEDAVKLEVLHPDMPASFTLKDPEVLRLIATTLTTLQTWNAVYPVKTEKLQILPSKTGFSLFRLANGIEVEVGKYPYLSLAVLCQRKLT